MYSLNSVRTRKSRKKRADIWSDRVVQPPALQRASPGLLNWSIVAGIGAFGVLYGATPHSSWTPRPMMGKSRRNQSPLGGGVMALAINPPGSRI